jgi:hypothetical protein
VLIIVQCEALSYLLDLIYVRRGGGIGRHARLKILCPSGRAGSSPARGTTYLARPIALPWRVTPDQPYNHSALDEIKCLCYH